MKIQTGISNAGLYLIIIIAVALAIVYLIYHHKKDKDEFSPLQGYILSSIRFIYMVIISILILSPLVETVKKRIEKPILLIGIDNSESVVVDPANEQFVNSVINEITAKSEKKYDLHILNFGKEVKQGAAPDFKDKISNYSDFIQEVDKRYYNLNVGAIVMVGDGIYNEGENPVQNIDHIQAPVYTIGIGDTMTITDQVVTDVAHNTNVFLGNSFPIEIEANFSNYNYPTTQLSVYLGGKMMFSEQIDIPQSDYYFSKSVNLQSEKIGLQEVIVVLSPVPGELNTENNRYRFTIEVHDNKYKVLFLTDAPHPDIGSLTETLKKQANFNITTYDLQSFDGELKNYDLVVLNQLPSLKLQQSDIIKKINDSRAPLLIIVGPNTSLSALNNLGLNFKLQPSALTQESAPYFNESFSLFNIPTNIKTVSPIFPPLLTYYTQYEFSSDYSVLAYQKINGIEMNFPLITTGEVNNRKVGLIAGEGIWRWKLYEFQNFENTDAFDQIFVSMFNYLCLREVKEQFKILYKRIAPEISPIRLKAQVFNEIYEPIITNEVRLTLIDSTGSELNYLFDSDHFEYNLNLGYLKPGEYKFTANTKIGETDFAQSGNFSIQEINIEKQNRKANFSMLNSLSRKTGGKLFLKDDWQDLLLTLDQNQNIKEKSHKEESISEVIDWKLLMIIILFFLTLEWFLRKFWGSY